GLLYLLHSTAADLLFVIAVRPDAPSPIVPLALTNALLGVDAPAVLILGGILSGLSLENAGAGLYFNLRWLLPTLPDPYAATFDLTTIPEQAPPSVGTLLAQITWAGGTSDPSLGYVLLPPPQGSSVVGTPFPSSIALRGGANDLVAVSRGAMPALLDLSTKVDLFGVALAPEIGRLAQSGGNRDQAPADPSNTAPALALTGMSLALNSALIATFALPQSSWEPMESTDPDEPGPIFCEPASDGFPLLISSPDSQRLVPFSPAPVLTSNIENVAAGHPFAALFSLPFGLNALIIEPNRHVATKFGRIPSSFIFFGGQFRENRPLFLESFVPNPPAGTPKLGGAVQLTLKPTFPDRPAAMFQGFTEPDTSHGPNIGPAPNGYGYTILGAISGVGTMFDGQFGSGGKLPGVPLRRIDFSGYGSSIFSEWNKPDEIPGIIKVQFETSIGRTGYEVIQAASVIYPYCILVVRTVTMQRQNAGWVKRTDSGWQAVSPGQFQFPADAANTQLLWANAVHPGALAGAFNVRNIRDNFGGEPIVVNTPSGFQFRKVLFDSDLGVNPNLNVVSGGFTAPIPGVPNPPVLTASRDMEGWVQILPIAQTPDPATMQQLFAQIGALTPAIACSIEAGRFNNVPGTTLRSSAFEVNIITEGNAGATVPALGVALRGAPQIPRGGGWSLGQRRYSDPAPSALPNDFPLPLVQPAGVNDFWYLADVTDVLQLTQPDNFYSLMHSTGTNKVLFESPQIPTAGASPGIQFPKPSPPGPPKPGAAPTNPGSPNLGDIASILNSTGLFPDVANVISLLQGTIEQINTIGQGFQYSKTFNFDPNEKVTIADLAGILNVVLQYADISLNNANPAFPVTPATLKYTVDSSASPSWTLSIGPLSFVVTIPKFSADPLLIITGGFYADEHTKAGLTNLNVQMGNALSLIKDVFSDLQSIAQYLPGGAGAQLDIALSNGKLTVTDTFSIADLPLGLGDLTDVSLNLSVGVQLQPLSVDFAIGVGSPDHPFNWIVSPLAGNGLMEFGLRANQPSFVIQAGIGLGLAIDLGIASGSASVTIAFRIDASGSEIILMAILSGQASVDVLDGLASATITLTAALGFGLSLSPPPVKFTPPPPSLPSSITLGPETITLLASCSVGIHLSICWVVSVDWDGSWQFSQSVTTPQITVNV
ncbi:MAG TPA: hypothetical protein VFA04_21660, partial [Bryobacteraceae bacterium]|nr:hypothetical protein [Bryobacteraceae bacterium]